MTLEKIEDILKSAIGLDTQSIGRSAVMSAVRRRMSSRELDDIHAYHALLTTSDAELTELVETVVIPETWFFRDHKPFVALGQLSRQKLSSRRDGGPLQLLSIPCSTGEEPYSMVMALLESGARPDQFHVDAIDISRKALEYAKNANYGAHSFRGHQDPAIIERYFARSDTRYVLRENIRRQVRFHQDNLLSDDSPLQAGRYDFIFCRNLLIYFDEVTKKQAFGRLHMLLRDDGLLFLGHAECGAIPRELFVNANSLETYAVRKTVVHDTTNPVAGRAPQAPPKRHRQRRSGATCKQRPPSTRPQSDPAQPPAPAPRDELALARQLADMGRMDEAREICSKYLEDRQWRSQAYFLRALIDSACGNTPQAEAYFRKAIYLDPQHYEALVHLSLLLAHQGDHDGANLLRRRAERARPQPVSG